MFLNQQQMNTLLHRLDHVEERVAACVDHMICQDSILTSTAVMRKLLTDQSNQVTAVPE